MNSGCVTTKRIVVCDDDRDICDFLKFLLTQAGYEVLIASGHQELLIHITQSSPHLVLLDIRMPDSDGFLTAETLRRRGHKQPIIFMSAHDNHFSRLYSKSVGAAGYFKKPFDNDALLVSIQKTLEI